eukprot:Em0016g143a
MAAEARNQLKGLLIGAGFPEECLAPCPLRVTGEDEKTDMVVALLCVGLYPNVCFHKEKRQLLSSEGKTALIHKTSVNNITKDPKFPSPYFVFGEKLKTRAVVSKMYDHGGTYPFAAVWIRLCGVPWQRSYQTG